MTTSPTVERRSAAPGGVRRSGGRRLTGRPRRLLRAAHVVAAGGWLGLVVAMLALGATAMTASVPVEARTGYRLMARIGGAVIPPFAVATLVTGLALSLLTPWGLIRHWWVAVKVVLGLAVIGTAVTLTDGWVAQALTGPADSSVAGRLIALSGVHLVLLTAATVVSVDKPWGRTPWGRRRQQRARDRPTTPVAG